MKWKSLVSKPSIFVVLCILAYSHGAHADTSADLDGDGLPDAWEQQIIDADMGDAITDIYDVLPDDDFDEDGFSNLSEYMLGLHPTYPDLFPAPSFEIVEDNGTNWFEFIYIKPLDPASGLTNYVLNICENMVAGSWYWGDWVVGTATFDSEYEAITNRIPMEGKDELYIRLVAGEWPSITSPYIVGCIRQNVPSGTSFWSYPFGSPYGNRLAYFLINNATDGDEIASAVGSNLVPVWASTYTNQIWTPFIELPDRECGYAYSSSAACTNFIWGYVEGEGYEPYTNNLSPGYNVVAYPYPASISLEELFVAPTPGDGVHIWDGVSQAYTEIHYCYYDSYNDEYVWLPSLPVTPLGAGQSVVYESVDAKDWIYYLPEGGHNPTPSTYSLMVVDGIGDGYYTNGTVVSVSADEPPPGYKFAGWIVDPIAHTNNLADETSSSTTFTMPATHVTLTANNSPVTYELVIKYGSGDGSYTNGAVVTVSADSAPEGYAFSGWTSDPSQYTNNLTDSFASSTSFTMPSTNVTLTANYLPVYLITTSAGANGLIVPENPTVVHGNDEVFSIQPDPGYHVETLTIDGTPVVPPVTTHTFTNVQSTHTIAATFLVNANTVFADASRPDNSGDGASWATAKKTIQAAVNVVPDGGAVWVANGTYETGYAVTPDHTGRNRVQITKPITVRSVSGPAATIIKGAAGSGDGHDVNSIRCVYMSNGCSLMGFTITNGYTRGSYGDLLTAVVSLIDSCGGGVLVEASCVVSNCILSGNKAGYQGGGAFLHEGGTLEHCWSIENNANSGGGVGLREGGTLNNCVLIDNTAVYYGGGADLHNGGTMNNCTVSKNSAENGDGISLFSGDIGMKGVVNNCVVWGNIWDDIYEESFGGTIQYTCASDGVTDGVEGCITSNPLFIDSASGNYQLQTNSTCINAGHNDYVMSDRTS